MYSNTFGPYYIYIYISKMYPVYIFLCNIVISFEAEQILSLS